MKTKNNNIVLIGFMGVGKGTTARALSKALKTMNLDCDDLLESSQNMKIKAIFDEFGEEYFRQLEKDLAKFLATNVKNAIISTGGGFAKVKNLNKIGRDKDTFKSLVAKWRGLLATINFKIRLDA